MDTLKTYVTITSSVRVQANNLKTYNVIIEERLLNIAEVNWYKHRREESELRSMKLQETLFRGRAAGRIATWKHLFNSARLLS